MRQIRSGLAVLGIDSETIIHHSTPRLFYATELYPGAIDEMMGFKKTIRGKKIGYSVSMLGDLWMRRWLLNRIQNNNVLEKVSNGNAATVKNSLMRKTVEEKNNEQIKVDMDDITEAFEISQEEDSLE